MEQIGWPGGTPVFGVHRLLDGPDSLTPTRKPHRANEPGSYSADVSDAARAGQRPSRTPGWRLPWMGALDLGPAVRVPVFRAEWGS